MTAFGLLAIAVVSCGDTDKPGCRVPDGTWRLTLTEEPDGECGVGTSEITVVGDGTREGFESLPSECTGWRSLSDDACEVDMDQTCAARDASGALLGHSRMIGTLHMVADDRIEGLVQLEIVLPDGESCTSEFTVVGAPAL